MNLHWHWRPGLPLTVLDARDRALFQRWCVTGTASRRQRLTLVVATTCGGAVASVVLALLPLFWSPLRAAGRVPLTTLVVSHVLVQLLKRTIGRPRPSTRLPITVLLRDPDRFSFPSGHAAAAMSIAWGYGLAFPHLAAPLAAMAVFVGLTRVCLGAHYPGDVVAGQALALLSGWAMFTWV